jgi:hypothetical protein
VCESTTTSLSRRWIVSDCTASLGVDVVDCIACLGTVYYVRR